MDIQSGRCEEYFSSLETNSFEMCSADMKDDLWEWDNDEREHNGDLALIPACSKIPDDFLDNSPPGKELHRIIHDWHHLSLHEFSEIEYFAKDMESMSAAISMPEQPYLDFDSITIKEEPLERDSPILTANDADSLLEQFEASQEVKCDIKSEDIKSEVVENNKNDILRVLPEELIAKIKNSSKRKQPVPIIEIPAKRHKHSKAVVPCEIKFEHIKTETIKLDHSYCTFDVSPYPKHPKKDSGFESAEEDDQHGVLRNQPTVTGADGKLMVSLLKVNTIHKQETERNKKRKLNFEEYKRRREGLFAIKAQPQDASSGPHVQEAEDEKAKLAKHQEKLLKMAAEILKTAPKKSIKAEEPVKEEPKEVKAPIEQAVPAPPPHIITKTLVSVGVNTDFEPGPAAAAAAKPRTKSDLCPPVEKQLEEIKPMLQNARIDSNSLIACVIKNLQEKSHKTGRAPEARPEQPDPESVPEHGEDKTIVFIPKDKTCASTRDICVQTDGSHVSKKGRGSSRHSFDCGSSASSYSSGSRSPSPARKPYPRAPHSQEREKLKEVEERRIVYVGGILRSTSKEDLRRRFQRFGPITNISVHFRDYGDSYGFVTFMYKEDAYEAVEHGNEDKSQPHYDLSFGGRRIFCRSRYSDLDNIQEDSYGYFQSQQDTFDSLLREMQAKLHKRKVYT